MAAAAERAATTVLRTGALGVLVAAAEPDTTLAPVDVILMIHLNYKSEQFKLIPNVALIYFNDHLPLFHF